MPKAARVDYSGTAIVRIREGHSMTLVNAIATTEALVLAADKRVRKKKNTYEDTVTKIVKLSNAALGTATGGVRLLGRGSDVVRFDVYEVMRVFFADQVFSAEKLGAFEGKLKEEFSTYCKTYRPGEIVLVSFQAMFYSRVDEGFRYQHRQCSTKRDGTLQVLGTNLKCDHSGVNPFGSTEVIDELMKGNRPQFDDLRADADVKKYVLQRQAQAIGTVTKDQALAFSKRLMKICHERYPLLGGTGVNPISETFDVYVIDAGGCGKIE
ncbi:MAG: hypothetical protein K8U57_27505 [Planctomycetes bacterium]|nr:hypothetical protein [Planctomycetota bacterium]